MENLIKKSEKAFAFKRDSSKYAILHSKGDSIAFIAVVDNQDDYKGWPPEKIISSTQFKVGIEILEALSQLRVYHVQKAKGDVQIFTNELPDVLFLKKNGVLVYSYFGVSSCPSEDEVSKTLLKVFQVIK